MSKDAPLLPSTQYFFLLPGEIDMQSGALGDNLKMKVCTQYGGMATEESHLPHT
jgi:hypothetical protein